MSSVALTPLHAHQNLPQVNPIAGSKTFEAAKIAFENLAKQLDSLHACKLLPYAQELLQINLSEASSSSPIHRTEKLNPAAERERIESPSTNAILRLCFLATFDEDNKLEKVPFTEQDLAAFVLSKTTRDRTYRWFILGMIPFTLLSGVQGFANILWPNSIYGQAAAITAAGTSVAAMGILFTGYNPDISQDCLNEKVDKLNRVKKELDEVARSLISFCFYKVAAVRKLAQFAADEINMSWIEKAATNSQKYAISKQDIAPSLELLTQAIAYIREGKTPENPELNSLLSNCLTRMEQQIDRKEWQPA